MVVLFVNTLLSWSGNNKQYFSTLDNNNLFLYDINLLLRDSTLTLIEENKSTEIFPLFQRFYKNSQSLRYILFVDKAGIKYGVPYDYSEILFHYRSLSTNKEFQPFYYVNFSKLNIYILGENNFLGLLIIGTNANFTLKDNLFLTNEIILFFTVIFFTAVTLCTVFVKVTITRPLVELSKGLRNITLGNFSSRINLQFDGNLGSLISSFNELSQQLELYERNKREQLLSEKSKLESVVTTITDGVVLLDTNLCIVVVNTMAIKIFGWRTKTRLIRTPIWNHLPLTLQKKLFVTLQDVITNTQNVIFDGEIEKNDLIQRPKRSIRIFLNIVYNSSDRDKIPIGIGLIIKDMTKEFNLTRTQNLFMSNISHELRTPLFNIKSFIETIQEYDSTLSKGQKRYFLDIVTKETNRLTRLVNDILCISRIDSLESVPLGSINLSEITHQTLANYQLIARDKSITLQSVVKLNCLYVQGNKDLLIQVLMNLVGNALRFTYYSGDIIVRAYKMKNQRIRVEIFDTGIGITYSSQQSIFKRFYRIENEVHTLKGAGLGLSIVETILLEHKSTINVISRYSVGSVFWFDLHQAQNF